MAAPIFLLFFGGAEAPADITGAAEISLAADAAAGTAFTGAAGITGAAEISLAADLATGTAFTGALPPITGTANIVLGPDTSALPPTDEDDFVTYGWPGGRPSIIDKPKRAPLVVVKNSDDTPKQRKLRNESIKLDKERRNLEQLLERMRKSLDDQIAMETLKQEANKAAAQFARVAGDYLSIDKRRKMMAMLMALLME